MKNSFRVLCQCFLWKWKLFFSRRSYDSWKCHQNGIFEVSKLNSCLIHKFILFFSTEPYIYNIYRLLSFLRFKISERDKSDILRSQVIFLNMTLLLKGFEVKWLLQMWSGNAHVRFIPFSLFLTKIHFLYIKLVARNFIFFCIFF